MQSPDGRIVRMVDVVLLKITRKGSDALLVVTKEFTSTRGGVQVPMKRLPGTKRRPDENQFLAAKRVLQRQLKINENIVKLDARKVQILEEDEDSPSFPGLRTVYRKRIMA